VREWSEWVSGWLWYCDNIDTYWDQHLTDTLHLNFTYFCITLRYVGNPQYLSYHVYHVCVSNINWLMCLWVWVMRFWSGSAIRSSWISSLRPDKQAASTKHDNQTTSTKYQAHDKQTNTKPASKHQSRQARNKKQTPGTKHDKQTSTKQVPNKYQTSNIKNTTS